MEPEEAAMVRIYNRLVSNGIKGDALYIYWA